MSCRAFSCVKNWYSWRMWSWLTGLTSDNWQAIGSIGTLIVAIVAALFARNQVVEARSIRLEQSQPQVVVDLQTHSILLELVITSTGATTARDVLVVFDPELNSTLIEQGRTKMLTSKLLTEGIASMPPGKEYRVLFEDATSRHDRDDLPRSYKATVTYSDSQGRKYEETYTLDLDALYGYNTISIYGVHDAAKALREMKSIIDKWSEFGAGLKVVSRDGDKKDEEEREYFRKMQEQDRRERYEESRRKLTNNTD